MSHSLKNVKLNDFRSFLLHHDLKHIRTSGGHEVWCGKDLTRPIIIQSHVDTIPIFIIKSNLRTMGLTLNDLRNFLESRS
jgi:hypothetical protein